MGYLSQKKKHARINFLLNTSLGVISITSFLALFDRSSIFSAFVNQWQFQIYIYLLIVFIYALFNRFFIQFLFAGLLIIINYMLIASSANLFNSSQSGGSQQLIALYQNQTTKTDALLASALAEKADIVAINQAKNPVLNLNQYPGYYLYNDDNDWEQSFIISKYNPIKAGKILFSPHFAGSYMTIIAGNQPLVFVNLDFKGISHHEEETVYHNLGEFVLAQDNPVVIIGDFGIPAWSKTFQSFLNRTGLEVKNHVILSDGSNRFNPFGVPSLNVLAYKNFGVKEVRFLGKDGNSQHPLLIKLSF